MTHKKLDIENIIDDAAKAVREEHINEAEAVEASARVWAKLSAAANVAGTANGLIEGCPDFQSLIPAFLDKTLSPARALLFEDHVGECVPCRRALKTHRAAALEGLQLPSSRIPVANTSRSPFRGRNWSKVARWSAAAAVVIGVGLAGLFAFERFDWSGRTLAATLEDTNGAVYVVKDGDNARLLAPGAQILKGERVRTSKNSTAVLRLADGSSVEMRERSEFSVSENRRGVTIALDRGDVIVEAAKQDRGRLYVKTPDSLVSVKGTIFAVESGTKGSRVSVVEGEVKVQQNGKDETLLPGDQTTSALLERNGVAETVGWSRNANKYTTLVAELAKLRKEINDRVPMPGVRYSSKLAALVPENTVFFAALPNLTETLSESERIMHERIGQNAALAEWWKERSKNATGDDQQTFARIREFGSQLGDEIVVSADTGSKGLLVLGELKDANSFTTYLRESVAKASGTADGLPKITIVDDNSLATAKSGDTPRNGELFVWTRDNIFAAATDVDLLRGLSQRTASPESNNFANSAFYKRIADAYTEGAGIIIAADIENIVAKTVRGEKPLAEKELADFGRLGIMNLRHFVAEQKNIDGRTLSSAELTFGDKRSGIASWLAKPGSMGALGFISPEASVATAFVVKEPALLVDDLVGFLETGDPEMRRSFDEIQKTQGIDVRRDFAEPLGGEFAFALDGPVLPTPSWKAVFEVYDQPRLQTAIEFAVEKLNQLSAEKGGEQLTWDNTNSGSRTYYSVKSPDAGIAVHYVFVDGYMIVAPNRALLDQAIANREAGNTLIRSPRFMSALPRDGNINFSAIFYHDLSPLVGPLAERMRKAGGELTEEQRRALETISGSTPPTLVYAYADDARLTIASNADGGAFGLNPASLIGLPNSFEMENILNKAIGETKDGAAE